MTLSVDAAPSGATSFEVMRHAMVASQLRTNAVNDVRVVEAMAGCRARIILPQKHIARSLIATRCCRSPAAASIIRRLPPAGC
jgi:protein-L-isoaspartate(D-aspartate) O-methyltransferase